MSRLHDSLRGLGPADTQRERRHRRRPVPPGLRLERTRGGERLRRLARISAFTLLALVAGAGGGWALQRGAVPDAALGPGAAPAAATVTHLRVAPDGGGERLRLELDRAIPHRVESRRDGQSLSIVLPGARLAHALPLLDLSDTAIRVLDARVERDELHLRLELGDLRRVQSVMTPSDRGAELIVRLLPEYPLELGAVSAIDPDTAAAQLLPGSVDGDLARGPLAAPMPGPEAGSAGTGAESAGAAPSPGSQPDPPPDTAARHESAPLKRASAEDEPARLYREGRAHQRAGRLAAAQSAFERALELTPGHWPAREALVRIHVSAGHLPRALELLADGRSLDIGNSAIARLEARLLVEGGFIGEALAVLAAHPPSVESDPDYHALRAALLQRTGRHAEAAELYALALTVDTRRARWWLGLGVTLDEDGHTDHARAAYAQALALDDLDEASRAWLRQRLAALEAGS